MNTQYKRDIFVYMPRNLTLDITRTVAILLMVIFHFIYDLTFFGFIHADIPDGPGWQQFRWVILSLFFLCMGASLRFSYGNGIIFRKFFRRWAQIVCSALLISVGTFFAIPHNWIFFGVLHFLALSSLIVVFFVRIPKICAAMGLSIIVLGLVGIMPRRWPWDLLFPNTLPSYTNDFVDIVPWLGVVFLGVTLGCSRWMLSDPLKKRLLTWDENKKNYASWPGKHSLVIYLVHQPILFAILFLVDQALML